MTEQRARLVSRLAFCEMGRAAARTGATQFDRPFAGDTRPWASACRKAWYTGFFEELERISMQSPITTEKYVCGDGKRFATKREAIDHANHVHAKTGHIISVERLKD